MYYFTGIFSGITITLEFKYELTASYYGGLLDSCSYSADCVKVPAEEIKRWMSLWNTKNVAYAEYVLSCSYICDALMRRNRMVFHGASFLWNNKIFIFSAPSGTGKTTQLKLWESLYGEEIIIQNGDKPILEVCSNGEVMVHSSPWKGKEDIGRDDIVAPLGGIILLRQSKKNLITHIEPSLAAKYSFGRIYSSFSTVEDVLIAGKLFDRVLSKKPVWLLNNKGDPESAKLTHSFLLEEVKR